MKALTIMNLPACLAEALKRKSLNQTVADLHGQRFGAQDVRSNGLGRLAGGWTEDELRDFERAIEQFEAVDERP
jgi:hypothetical protein